MQVEREGTRARAVGSNIDGEWSFDGSEKFHGRRLMSDLPL